MGTLRNITLDVRKHPAVYAMFVPILAYFVLFAYIPMTGIVMAFQEYEPSKGVAGSAWVGLQNFKDFFGSYYFWRLIRNTFFLSFMDLLINFPVPILFALMLNEVSSHVFKRTVQTISYMPYFVSLIVICGIISEFSASDGILSQIVRFFGGPPGNLLGKAEWFRPIFIGSNLWQGMGYNSIIYLAALSGIDTELYEAAKIDGAGRWRQTWSITLPCLVPTIAILLILRMGMMFNVGFEKVLLLYSPATYSTSDIISTFTYRKGLLDMNFSFSTAVGMFNSLINTAMLLVANRLSRKFTESSLF